jgi:hypothetical protein
MAASQERFNLRTRFNPGRFTFHAAVFKDSSASLERVRHKPELTRGNTNG